MSKILDIDFRQGSVKDKITGISPTGTYSFLKKSKGYFLNSVNGISTYSPKFKLLYGEDSMSIIVWSNKRIGYLNFQALINGFGLSSFGNAGAYYNINSTGGGTSGTGMYSSVVGKLEDNHIVFIFDGKQTTTAKAFLNYINGVYGGVSLAYGGTLPSGLPRNDGAIQIYSKQALYRVQVFDHILTQKEIGLDYKEFLNSKATLRAVTGFTYPKQELVNERGLIAAYNMRPVRGQLVNIAAPNPANGMNPSTKSITLSKTSTLKDNIYLVGQSRSISTVNIGNTKSISFVIKPTINNIDIIQLSALSKIYIDASNNIVTTGITSPIINVNGVNTNILTLNVWNVVTITTNTFINVSDFILGYSSSYFKGFIKDLKLYDRPLSDQEIKSYHNQFASRIAFYDDFSQYAVNNLPYNYQKKSGTWIIQETGNLKYLKCTSAGVIVYPFNARYRTIKFKIAKGSDSNVLDFLLSNQNKAIVAGNTGYAFRFDSDERFKLYSFNGTTLTQIGSSSPIYLINTLYTVEIKLYTDNRIKVFIDNKSIIEGTSSAYTSTKYITFDFDLYDIITSIKITEGIII